MLASALSFLSSIALFATGIGLVLFGLVVFAAGNHQFIDGRPFIEELAYPAVGFCMAGVWAVGAAIWGCWRQWRSRHGRDPGIR